MLAQITVLLKAYGLWGMLILSFSEAAFLPIPPELLFVPLCLTQPGNALLFALLATIATTSGSFFGYMLGKVFGHPLLHYFVSEKKVARIEDLFQRYGIWVVFLAGAAPPPTPFKMFTISSGIFGLKLPHLLLAAALGRGLRYFLEAFLIWRGGQQALHLLMSQRFWVILLAAALLLTLVLLQKRLRRLIPQEWLEKGLFQRWRQLFRGKALLILGEWLAALGCAGFLAFFLADIASESGVRNLHQIDVWAGQWLNLHLGPLWPGISEVLGGVLLTVVIIVTCLFWYRTGKKEHIAFLMFNLVGSSVILVGFERVLWETYQLGGGPNPLPMALLNTLWASYVLCLVTEWRPSIRGRRLAVLSLGLLFLALLALTRLAAGYLLSDVLISYATAGLWLVVVWIILLYRENAEPDPS